MLNCLISINFTANVLDGCDFYIDDFNKQSIAAERIVFSEEVSQDSVTSPILHPRCFRQPLRSLKVTHNPLSVCLWPPQAPVI